jgi:uncharacterized protein (DUF1778 family)
MITVSVRRRVVARLVRLPIELDTLLHAAAGLRGTSMTAYIVAAVQAQVRRDARAGHGASLASLLAQHGE